MKTYNHYNTIEEFILDNDFVSFVRRNKREEIIALYKCHPDKEVISQAILLIQKMKIEEHDVSCEQITEGLTAVMKAVSPGRKKKITHWLLTSAASIAAIIIIFFHQIPTDISLKDEMLSLLASQDVNMEDIQILSGDNQILVKNEETIKQTKEGHIIIGDTSKIESTDIKSEYLQLIVPNGKQTTIKFSDGSVAWINSGSKLLYPKQFNEKTREIFVDGEIYLEIAPEQSRPFYARTAKFDVKVLGTRFNINAYSTDMENSVVLVQGSVEVSSQSSKNKLGPSQGVFFEKENTIVKEVDTYQYTCWKDGIMIFDGESLGTIMQKLSRYYKVEIIFERHISDELYKGKLSLNNSLEEILYNLSRTAFFTYTQVEDTIYIK